MSFSLSSFFPPLFPLLTLCVLMWYIQFIPELTQDFYVDEPSLMPAQTFPGSGSLVQDQLDGMNQMRNGTRNGSLCQEWNTYLERKCGKEENDWEMIVVRSAIGLNRESILVVSHAEAQDKQMHDFAVARLLGWASFFENVKWLEKDIVFVHFSTADDDFKDSISNFVDAIYSTDFSVPTIGLPIIAFVIDFENWKNPSHLYFDAIGANAQLPNLDILSTLTQICTANRFPVASIYMEELFLNKYTGFFSFFFRQAFGVPLAHAEFLKNGIPSVTIGWKKISKKKSVELVRVGIVSAGYFSNENQAHNALNILLELLVRSFNNLQESLHHSHFFYFLCGWNRFLAMGRYFNLFFIGVVPALLHQFLLVLNLRNMHVSADESALFLLFIAFLRVLSTYLASFCVFAVIGVSQNALVITVVTIAIASLLVSFHSLTFQQTASKSSNVMFQIISFMCAGIAFAILLFAHFPLCMIGLTWHLLVSISFPLDSTLLFPHLRYKLLLGLLNIVLLIIHFFTKIVFTPLLLTLAFYYLPRYFPAVFS